MTFPTRSSSQRGSSRRKAEGHTPPKSTYFNPVAHICPPNPVPSPANSSPSPLQSQSQSQSPPPPPPSSSTQCISRPIEIPIPSSSSSPIAVASSRELRRINRLFNIYSDSKDVIDPEGIEDLCRNLELEYTDVKILMLAWKMKAKKQGFFYRNEWRIGLARLKADDIEKLKNALRYLEIEARTPPNFEDFFSYSFRYCLTEERQKSLDIDTICVLLDIVMGPLFRPQVELIIEFLKAQTEYRALNMDHWMCIFHFCKKISFPDLQNYDPDEGWPAILDTFVEWLKDKLG